MNVTVKWNWRFFLMLWVLEELICIKKNKRNKKSIFNTENWLGRSAKQVTQWHERKGERAKFEAAGGVWNRVEDGVARRGGERGRVNKRKQKDKYLNKRWEGKWEEEKRWTYWSLRVWLCVSNMKTKGTNSRTFVIMYKYILYLLFIPKIKRRHYI